LAAYKITPHILPDRDTCTRKSVRDAVLLVKREDKARRASAVAEVEQAEAARRTLANLKPRSQIKTDETAMRPSN
jgi:hypothetical protein